MLLAACPPTPRLPKAMVPAPPTCSAVGASICPRAPIRATPWLRRSSPAPSMAPRPPWSSPRSTTRCATRAKPMRASWASPRGDTPAPSTASSPCPESSRWRASPSPMPPPSSSTIWRADRRTKPPAPPPQVACLQRRQALPPAKPAGGRFFGSAGERHALRQQKARQHLLQLLQHRLPRFRRLLLVGERDHPVPGIRGDPDPQLQFLPRLPPALGDQQIAQYPARPGRGIRLALPCPFADVVAQRQFAEVRPALQKIHIGVEHPPQRFSRGEDQLASTERALDPAPEGFQFPHRNAIENLLPVRVEPVQRAHRDSRLPGNPAGGDLFERHAPQQRRCRVEYLLHGLVAARL